MGCYGAVVICLGKGAINLHVLFQKLEIIVWVR